MRRRWPLSALWAGLVPETLLSSLGYGTGTSSLSGMVLLYSVAAHRGLAISLVALVVSLVAYLTGAAAGPVGPVAWNQYVIVAVVLVAVWGGGQEPAAAPGVHGGAEGPCGAAGAGARGRHQGGAGGGAFTHRPRAARRGGPPRERDDGAGGGRAAGAGHRPRAGA
ncbi:hypothetical protein [Nonomuraea salmonea]|uniref:hypothetical protein n=1 Tax=Nonomuraea salmonea TaxID=46181 RepID=UPI0031EFA17E